MPPRNEIESTLCSIWQEILHLDRVGINDNFFKIGGDSILAVQLISRMKREKMIITIKDIFEQKIIRNLIERVTLDIENDVIEFDISGKVLEQNAAFDPYVIFNKNQKDVVFLLPPGDGGAESYFNNVVQMLNNKKIVAFNNYYNFLFENFGEEHIKNITYEQLAKIYIKHIKEIQKNGVYNILGWSFGGVLAFEIVRQLLLDSNDRFKLCIIDSFFCYKDAINHLTETKQIIESKSVLENIYYMYNQKIEESYLQRIQIHFFKCVIHDENHGFQENSNDMAIFKYYIHQSTDNFVNNVAPKKSITVIPIEASHLNWINDKHAIKKICDIFLKVLSHL